MRKLIINADDYGISTGVSLGILEASRGVVSSTTVMGNLVSEKVLTCLIDSELSAGIHLNLTAGPPLTHSYPEVLLKPEGNLCKKTGLRESTWDTPELCQSAKHEWTSQISRLLDLGLKPTHLDSHHHVHLISPLFDIALELAASHGLGIRTRKLQQNLALSQSVKTPDLLVEEFFGTRQITTENIRRLLNDTENYQSVELICHPGNADTDLSAISGYTAEREQELSVLGSESLRNELEYSGWKLCGYNEL